MQLFPWQLDPAVALGNSFCNWLITSSGRILLNQTRDVDMKITQYGSTSADKCNRTLHWMSLFKKSNLDQII